MMTTRSVDHDGAPAQEHRMREGGEPVRLVDDGRGARLLAIPVRETEWSGVRLTLSELAALAEVMPRPSDQGKGTKVIFFVDGEIVGSVTYNAEGCNVVVDGQLWQGPRSIANRLGPEMRGLARTQAERAVASMSALVQVSARTEGLVDQMLGARRRVTFLG